MDIARRIASVPAGTIIIEGHTDSKGSAQYNKDLSLQRAKAVAQWLVKHGGARFIRRDTAGPVPVGRKEG